MQSILNNYQQVPYGNARRNGNTFTCQHGNNECLGNMQQACLQAHYPNVSVHLPIIYCQELKVITEAIHRRPVAYRAYSCHNELYFVSFPPCSTPTSWAP